MSAPTTDEISVEREGGVMTLRLNAPDRLNAVSAAMLSAVCHQIEASSFDPSVRAVVLTGSGRAFCAGADLGAGDVLFEDGRTPDPAVVDAAHRLIVALTTVDKPVLCALNGLAAGLGVSLALACDIVVAHESAYFLLAFAKVGLMPDGGATALLAASLGRSRAMQMMLMADRLSISEAQAAGVVRSVHDEATFADAVSATARALAAGPTSALGCTKRAVNAASIGSLSQVMQREKEGQMRLVIGPEYREGVRAFNERRGAIFT